MTHKGIMMNVPGQGFVKVNGSQSKDTVGYSISEEYITYSEVVKSDLTLIATEDRLYKFEKNTITPLGGDVEDYLSEQVITTGLDLNATTSVIGTLSGGVVFIDKLTGNSIHTLNYQTGLPDDEVFQLHEDKEGRFWPVTLNGVIAYLDKEETFYLEPHTKNQIQASRMMKGYCELHDSGIALAKIGVGIVRIKDDKIVEVTKDVNPQYIWAEGNDMMVLESNTVTNNTTGERILTLPLQGHHPARGGHHKGITAISDGLDCHLIKDGNVLGHFQIPSEYREIIFICLWIKHYGWAQEMELWHMISKQMP